MGSFLLLAVGLIFALWLLDVTRSERDAKMQALSQVAQLADGRRVRELELRAHRLWPATPTGCAARRG